MSERKIAGKIIRIHIFLKEQKPDSCINDYISKVAQGKQTEEALSSAREIFFVFANDVAH